MTSSDTANALRLKHEQRSSRREPLTQAERHQLLIQWNDTHSDYPADSCIHELFEAQVARTPDNVAVAYEGDQRTYAELNCRANQLARYLRKNGIGPGAFVGICVDRSLEMVDGLLGILKTGAAYLPLDPAYPKDRLKFMLTDAQVPLLLTQRRLLDGFPEHAGHAVCIDTDWDSISQEAENNPTCTAAPDHLAYVIYTSGSTGVPKGVMVPHRSVVNFLTAMRREPGLEDTDTLLAVTTLSFDIAVLELLLPLIVGARVVVATRDTASNGTELSQKLIDCGATVMQATPATWRILLESGWEGSDRLKILCGGEAMSQDLATGLLTKGKCLWNLYGPTETTVWSTVYEVEEVAGAVPIGRPIANTQIYLLDSGLQLVQPGEPGELCIGGEGVTRGYLNRPDVTAEKFISNPFSRNRHDRIYRTGDIARHLPDGNIAFLGRTDHQVKIRGHRIELGEIETVLATHPSVKQALALTREDRPGDQRIVAYVATDRSDAPMTSELRRRLQKKLPEYMLPAAFVLLDGFPLTPNGKVDRLALPAPGPSRPELEQPFVPARTKAEREIANVWEEVLGFDRIGVHDNFFELGGHSLKATQIITRLRDSLQVELPLHLFFESPTIAQLAKMIEDEQGGVYACRRARIPSVARNADLPLSFSQERVWFLQRLVPESIAYNFQCTLRFTGCLDAGALERSLSEIVRRHEIYRTTFPAADGRPVQVIHKAKPVELPFMDLRTLPENEREEKKQRLLESEFQKRFDVSKLPLVRWILLRLDETERVLVHVEHHLVHDGWSFNVFLHELLELYKAFSAGKPSPLPELPVQFADFAHWQREWMKGTQARQQLDFWKHQLNGCPPVLDLPTDRLRPSIQSFRGAAPRVEIPLSLCKSLRELSKQEGVSLFMTMFAAFATLLHRYCRQDDVPIGSGIANRRWRETESMIGMIINNIVLRADLSGNPTFCELLQRVRDVILRASAHQDLPFDMMVEALQPQRHLSHNPLFQVMFGFHDAPMPQVELPELDLDLGLVLSNRSAKFDMTIIVIPHSEQRLGLPAGSEEDGLTVIWEYNTDLFDEATITRITGHFLTLLKAVAADPGQRVWELQLQTKSERDRLVNDWNQTSTLYPKEATVHQLFEQQAAAASDSVAVRFEDRQLTYGELNARANQLAHYLRDRGVGPEVMVGICIERGLEMVVGILGILKAGGAYVPLDPHYPKQRLSFMVQDTKTPVLLTQSHLANKLPVHDAELICLDADWPTIAPHSEEDPDSRVQADNLAYVIYTSGSTGQPKGTCVAHRSVVRLVKNTNYVSLGPEHVVAQASNCSFDAVTFELWGALLKGARLVGVSKETALSPEHLVRQIERDGITTLFLTTALFNQIAREMPRGLEGLDHLLFGGEKVDPHWVREVLKHGPPAHFLHVYGPTETTTFASWYPIGELPETAHTVPIGGPISNTQLYVLDKHGEPVPVGVPGELHIGGPGVARGYLNQPELTDERFVPDTFSEAASTRLYKTGDLVRWLPEGAIEFLGRTDHQVKIRGFRVELGEIEAVLDTHPAVREAVVLCREDRPGEKRLVAYVVPGQQGTFTATPLRQFLQRHLPDYMVPGAFVVMESLPLTANGKLDRKALPAPEGERQVQQTYVPPGSDTERRIADVWREVLQVEKIGVHDDFFELGGHSLLAIRLTSRLRDALSLELPLGSVFEYPTVAGLATYVDLVCCLREGAEGPPRDEASAREKGVI